VLLALEIFALTPEVGGNPLAIGRYCAAAA
jgi:hypothetical protein